MEFVTKEDDIAFGVRKVHAPFITPIVNNSQSALEKFQFLLKTDVEGCGEKADIVGVEKCEDVEVTGVQSSGEVIDEDEEEKRRENRTLRNAAFNVHVIR